MFHANKLVLAPRSSPTYRSKAFLLRLFFVRASVAFVLSSYLFLISPSFGASGGLCFVIVTIRVSLHLYFRICVPTHQVPSENGYTLKRRVFSLGSKCFLLK